MVKFDRGRVMQRIRGGRGRCRRLQLEHSGERGVGLENIVAVPADRSSGRQDIGHIGVRDGDAARSRGPATARTTASTSPEIRETMSPSRRSSL